MYIDSSKCVTQAFYVFTLTKSSGNYNSLRYEKHFLSCYFDRSIIVKLSETVSQILWFYYLCVRLCGPNVWIEFIKIATTVIHIFKKIYVQRLSYFCKPITSNEIWQRATQFHNFFSKRFLQSFLTILYRVFY